MLVNGLSSALPSLSKPAQSLDSKESLDTHKESKSLQSTSAGDSNSEEKSSQTVAAEQRELQLLKARDREVRAHELAHVSVGGRYITSGAHYSFQKGPDGRLYAVGGEVSINTSEIPGDPRATLLKAQTVARAALAPASPSAQDRNVAAQAAVLIQQARVDLATLLTDNSPQQPGQKLDAFA